MGVFSSTLIHFPPGDVVFNGVHCVKLAIAVVDGALEDFSVICGIVARVVGSKNPIAEVDVVEEVYIPGIDNAGNVTSGMFLIRDDGSGRK